MNPRWPGWLATGGVHALLLVMLAGALHRSPTTPAVPPKVLLVSARPVALPATVAPTPSITPELPGALRMMPAVTLVEIPVIADVTTSERPAAPEAPSPVVVAMASPSAHATAAEPTGAGAAMTARVETPPVQETPAAFPANHRQCSDQQTARHYPAMLRERGVQGLVRLRVKVDENGHAAEVIVADGSGFRLMDEAARRVAESCPYVPARRGDQRLASWIEYAVRFALQ